MAALAALTLPQAAWAQGFDFASGNQAPVEITSDQGLVLSQDAHTVTASGHAKAARGEVTVAADQLVAFYRQRGETGAPAKPAPTPAAPSSSADQSAIGGDSEIWKVEAQGNVVITSPSAKALGDRAVYSIDEAVVRLTGKNLRLTTQTDTITARDSLEYWEAKKLAIARGQAVAVAGPRRLQADTINADFVASPGNGGQGNGGQGGALTLSRAQAVNHVILTAPGEIVTGDRGDYAADSGIVTLTGSVKMTRDKNQLDGGYAIVNLNTGISKLLPAPPGNSGGETQVPNQVRGLLSSSTDAAGKRAAATGNR